MKRSIVFCLLGFFLNIGYGQDLTANRIERLTIGDTLPNLSMMGVVNGKDSLLQFKDLRGKLIILDFWDVWCASCIKDMPHLKELQNKFGDRVQFVSVTKSTKKQVLDLASRNTLVKEFDLPMVMGDTILSRLFPYKSVPAHVWINEEGIVEEITAGPNTTEESIAKFLRGEKVNLPVKEDLMDFDEKAPFILEGNARQWDRMIGYSSLFKWIPTGNAGGGISVDENGVPNGIGLLNCAMIDMYQIAYGEAMGGDRNGFKLNKFHNVNRVVLEMDSAAKYLYPNDPTERSWWLMENTYSYQSKLNMGNKQRLFDLMKRDLELYFGFKGNIEKRNKKCLVVSKKGTGNLLAANDEKPYRRINPERTLLIIRNYPMKALINFLEILYPESEFPFIDASDIDGNISLEIKTDLKNLERVKLELQRYGLELKLKNKKLDLLVIK